MDLLSYWLGKKPQNTIPKDLPWYLIGQGQSFPPISIVDKKPYTVRPVLDGQYIDQKITKSYPKIIGGSIIQNQKITDGNFMTNDAWTAYSGTFEVNDGVGKYTITEVSSQSYGNRLKNNTNISWRKGHKYLFGYTHRESKGDGTSANSGYIHYTYIASNLGSAGYTNTAWRRDYTVKNFTDTSTTDWIAIRLTNTNASPRAIGDWFEIKDVILLDLTQLFGSEIANYIYSLESNSKGSGITWMKSFGFLESDYYTKDLGSFKNTQLISRITTDRNQVSKTYLFDNNLKLYGVPKLDSNNNFYYSGDIYTSEGRVVRKTIFIDLGSLDWSYNTNYSKAYFEATVPNMKLYSSVRTMPLICPKYECISDGRSFSDTPDKSMYNQSGINKITIMDSSYSDKTFFTDAVSGVYLLCEAEVETYETVEAFQAMQKVDVLGTEEFITLNDNGSMKLPIGHETIYKN